MDQEICLIELEVNQLSIEQIYSITWNIVVETKRFINRPNTFICPHTIRIKGQATINYEPINCNICRQGDVVRTRNWNEQYKYMICGIIYFLVEGRNNLNQYYRSFDFFFFKDISGSYNQNYSIFRSLWQIMERNDYLQKRQIMEMMPQANRPIVLRQFEFQRFCIIIIDPCLGAPTSRLQESNTFQLISFQRLLIDLQNIQIQIGMNNQLPPPCYHNIFIGRSYSTYCKFRINIFQTNPICRCQNNRMGTILYALLTGREYNIQNNANNDDQFPDDPLIIFSRHIINTYEINNPQQQFQQYQQIVVEICNIRQQLSQIIEDVIDVSFFAHRLRIQLQNIQANLLWNYYKILFLQEMIELIENKIITQPIFSFNFFELLLQLKEQQCLRIQNYLVIQDDNLLSEILICYLQQIQANENIEIEEPLGQIGQNFNQTPELYQIRWNLFQHFSQVNAFNDPNNQFFRDIFQHAEFNHHTILAFEDQLQNN